MKNGWALVKRLNGPKPSFWIVPVKQLLKMDFVEKVYSPFRPDHEEDFILSNEYGMIVGKNIVMHYILCIKDTKKEIENVQQTKLLNGKRLKTGRKRLTMTPAVFPAMEFTLRVEQNAVQLEKKGAVVVVKQEVRGEGGANALARNNALLQKRKNADNSELPTALKKLKSGDQVPKGSNETKKTEVSEGPGLVVKAPENIDQVVQESSETKEAEISEDVVVQATEIIDQVVQESRETKEAETSGAVVVQAIENIDQDLQESNAAKSKAVITNDQKITEVDHNTNQNSQHPPCTGNCSKVAELTARLAELEEQLHLTMRECEAYRSKESKLEKSIQREIKNIKDEVQKFPEMLRDMTTLKEPKKKVTDEEGDVMVDMGAGIKIKQKDIDEVETDFKKFTTRLNELAELMWPKKIHTLSLSGLDGDNKPTLTKIPDDCTTALRRVLNSMEWPSKEKLIDLGRVKSHLRSRASALRREIYLGALTPEERSKYEEKVQQRREEDASMKAKGLKPKRKGVGLRATFSSQASSKSGNDKAADPEESSADEGTAATANGEKQGSDHSETSVEVKAVPSAGSEKDVVSYVIEKLVAAPPVEEVLLSEDEDTEDA